MKQTSNYKGPIKGLFRYLVHTSGTSNTKSRSRAHGLLEV